MVQFVGNHLQNFPEKSKPFIVDNTPWKCKAMNTDPIELTRILARLPLAKRKSLSVLGKLRGKSGSTSGRRERKTDTIFVSMGVCVCLSVHMCIGLLFLLFITKEIEFVAVDCGFFIRLSFQLFNANNWALQNLGRFFNRYLPPLFKTVLHSLCVDMGTCWGDLNKGGVKLPVPGMDHNQPATVRQSVTFLLFMSKMCDKTSGKRLCIKMATDWQVSGVGDTWAEANQCKSSEFLHELCNSGFPRFSVPPLLARNCFC